MAAKRKMAKKTRPATKRAPARKSAAKAKAVNREFFLISGSPFAWRAQLALAVKRLPYAPRVLQASKAEHKAPEYLAINPRGKIPALKDGDVVMRESLAIIAYLDRRYPNPPLFGRNPKEAARVWQQVCEISSYIEPAAGRVTRPVFFNKVAGSEDDIRAAMTEIRAELGRLERELARDPWLAGKAVSAADICAYPFIKSLLRAAGKPEAASLNLDILPFEGRYPRLAKWMARVEAIPGAAAASPPHWR
jgi:glutathione S-transferase